MKRIWSTLLVIVLSAVGFKFLGDIVPDKYSNILTFIYLVILVVVGHFMSPSLKKNNRWLGKVVLSLLIIFIFALRMNWLVLVEFNRILSIVGLNSNNFLDLLLVYCGWAFFQI